MPAVRVAGGGLPQHPGVSCAVPGPADWDPSKVRGVAPVSAPWGPLGMVMECGPVLARACGVTSFLPAQLRQLGGTDSASLTSRAPLVPGMPSRPAAPAGPAVPNPPFPGPAPTSRQHSPLSLPPSSEVVTEERFSLTSFAHQFLRDFWPREKEGPCRGGALATSRF